MKGTRVKRIFNEEHKKFIKDNAIGIRNEELTKKLNETFNTKFTVGQVKKYKHSHKINSGLKSCNLPVGSERENKGYTLIKIAEPNVWIEKHRYIYEKKHGKIPDGHKVIFADKNNKNFEEKNLILVSNSEVLIMNTHKLIYEEAELTKTGSIIAKLIDKTNRMNLEKGKFKNDETSTKKKN